MVNYDYVIVGAGPFGCAFARTVTDSGAKCLVVDKREHIAGNCYTESREGTDVHMYGPHIFHTSSDPVWEFVNQFGKFNNFVYRPKAINNGRLYSFPINLMTLNQMFGVKTPEDAEALLRSKRLHIEAPANFEEACLASVGEEIYRTFFYWYTKKKWSMEPRDLPATLLTRVPVRNTFNDNYFNDPHQGIPIDGYTSLFKNMLEGIDVELGVDYFKHRDRLDGLCRRLVYTGPIDRFYEFEFGHLGWVGLEFEHTSKRKDHQGAAVVNYTDETPYLRSTEHAHFSMKDFPPVSIVTLERSSANGEACYPIPISENRLLHNKYKSLKSSKYIFGGRLANYVYLNMDQVIASAINTAKSRMLDTIHFSSPHLI